MKARSQTRLWVKWHEPINGYSDMIYWSFETERSVKMTDINYGLQRLKKLVNGKLEGLYAVAIIYDNRTNQIIEHFDPDKLR